jgi:peptide/nickel transport system ATP-binding protein
MANPVLPVLDVRNLKVEFQTDQSHTVAVDRISFQVERGKTLGIVGESGSGKSVTSLAIMGLVATPGRITDGEIYFSSHQDEQSVELLSLDESARRQYRGKKIAMIFQEPMSSLNPVYNIGFQITEAIQLHQPNVTLAQAQKQAIATLQEVQLLPQDEVLEEQCLAQAQAQGDKITTKEIKQYINQQKYTFLKRYPHELSGGQLQRVMIAMALVCDPDLLIADEPTTALDVTVQATILKLLRTICEQRNMSLIFITHDLGVIAEVAHQVVVMFQGQVMEQGSVQDIFSQAQHPYTKGLLACRPPLDRQLRYLPTVKDFMAEAEPPTQESEPSDGVLQEPGEPFIAEAISLEEQKQRLSQLVALEPLLEVHNLQVGYPVRGMFGGVKKMAIAVNNVSFEVYPGETLGLVGESGCGKSTIARTLMGLINPLSGKILFQNKPLKPSTIQGLRREIQIIFQNPYSSLNPRMTIGKAIAEPLIIHGIGKDRQKRKERVLYLMERVGLKPEWYDRFPHEFSGGQRQRICIARALSINPKFVICDESVSALDVSVQAQVLNLLKELQQEFGLTYIFISHDLSVVKFMSDRIMVMNQGQIEEIDAAGEIYNSPQTSYTRRLIASIPSGKLPA